MSNNRPASTEQSTADPATMPLVDILRGFTTKEVLAVGTVLVTIITASAGTGAWYEGRLREEAVATAEKAKDLEIGKLTDQLGELVPAFDSLSQDHRATKATLADARRFIAFADKYITYLVSENEPALGILGDHVCMLYRQSQEQDVGITIDTTTIAGALNNRSGPELRQELIAMGIDPELANEIAEVHAVGVQRNLPNVSRLVGYSVAPSSVVSPFNGKDLITDPRRVKADVMKRLSGRPGELVKIVSFHVGNKVYSYTMPSGIARYVHEKPDCRLR
ncbi:hypothetical protein [Paracoccus rhizosphaerae]|uniref:Uncharacterized protein n=1 Tax=Paracoccus rhizosphaerae TaxID=1133347 RepID=A0ABV6CH43_9RHOB|nr:hypothetical protein [Paracoccus rhizosphaerae]